MLNTDWAGCVSVAAWKEISTVKTWFKQLIVLTEEANNVEKLNTAFQE